MIVHVIATPTGAIWSRLGPYDPTATRVSVRHGMWHAANVEARTPGELRAKFEKAWDIPPEAIAVIRRHQCSDTLPLDDGDYIEFVMPR